MRAQYEFVTGAPRNGSTTIVRQIEVPSGARELATLARIDYEGCFEVDIECAIERTAEEWARAVLENAPASTRASLVAGWTSIGLQIALSPSPRQVLGWDIRRDDPEVVLLGARSRIGLPAELLLTRSPGCLQFCTFVQQSNVGARTLWALVEPVHVPTVRRLLEQAGTRCRTRTSKDTP